MVSKFASVSLADEAISAAVDVGIDRLGIKKFIRLLPWEGIFSHHPPNFAYWREVRAFGKRAMILWIT